MRGEGLCTQREPVYREEGLCMWESVHTEGFSHTGCPSEPTPLGALGSAHLHLRTK